MSTSQWIEVLKRQTHRQTMSGATLLRPTLLGLCLAQLAKIVLARRAALGQSAWQSAVIRRDRPDKDRMREKPDTVHIESTTRAEERRKPSHRGRQTETIPWYDRLADYLPVNDIFEEPAAQTRKHAAREKTGLESKSSSLSIKSSSSGRSQIARPSGACDPRDSKETHLSEVPIPRKGQRVQVRLLFNRCVWHIDLNELLVSRTRFYYHFAPVRPLDPLPLASPDDLASIRENVWIGKGDIGSEIKLPIVKYPSTASTSILPLMLEWQHVISQGSENAPQTFGDFLSERGRTLSYQEELEADHFEIPLFAKPSIVKRAPEDTLDTGTRSQPQRGDTSKPVASGHVESSPTDPLFIGPEDFAPLDPPRDAPLCSSQDIIAKYVTSDAVRKQHDQARREKTQSSATARPQRPFREQHSELGDLPIEEALLLSEMRDWPQVEGISDSSTAWAKTGQLPLQVEELPKYSKTGMALRPANSFRSSASGQDDMAATKPDEFLDDREQIRNVMLGRRNVLTSQPDPSAKPSGSPRSLYEIRAMRNVASRPDRRQGKSLSSAFELSEDMLASYGSQCRLDVMDDLELDESPITPSTKQPITGHGLARYELLVLHLSTDQCTVGAAAGSMMMARESLPIANDATEISSRLSCVSGLYHYLDYLSQAFELGYVLQAASKNNIVLVRPVEIAKSASESPQTSTEDGKGFWTSLFQEISSARAESSKSRLRAGSQYDIRGGIRFPKSAVSIF